MVLLPLAFLLASLNPLDARQLSVAAGTRDLHMHTICPPELYLILSRLAFPAGGRYPAGPSLMFAAARSDPVQGRRIREGRRLRGPQDSVCARMCLCH